jgi:pilus assembly protein TadC
MSLAAAVCVGAVMVLSMRSRRVERRFVALQPIAAKAVPASVVRGTATMRAVAATIAGVAVGLVVGGVGGVATAVVVAVALARALSRLESRKTRERREALLRDLPAALDLLSACLRAGSTVDDAVVAVARALGGPVAEEFGAVVAALHVGVPPADAWRALQSEPLAGIGRAFARAAQSGAPLADVAARAATDRRTTLELTATAAARRAGVATAGPLGVCFLPAFICSAVVPVVAGLARGMLS